MAASAVLCLAGGLLGVLSGNMQIRDIGIIGYGVVFPSPSSTWLVCSLDRRQVAASRRMLPDQRWQPAHGRGDRLPGRGRGRRAARPAGRAGSDRDLSLIHISEPTRLLSISYAVFCLKKK